MRAVELVDSSEAACRVMVGAIAVRGANSGACSGFGSATARSAAQPIEQLVEPMTQTEQGMTG